MERKELPAVVTVGGLEFQHSPARLWAELDSGAAVHVVTKHNGRHRGWLVTGLPAGYEAERISASHLFKHVGEIMDDVRDGIVYEITVHRKARGYLMFTAPDEIAALGWDVTIPYWTHTRAGRVQREIYPIALSAEPLPPWRRVLAGA
jgi:hypothetical protein